jgi:hypothetical protein
MQPKDKYFKSIAPSFFFMLLGILSSRAMGPNYGPILQLILVALLVSPYFPSRSRSQRFALSVTLIVGISPLYLLVRGFVTRAQLSAADLSIYFLLFLFTVSILHFLNSSKKIDRPAHIAFQNPLNFFSTLSGFLLLLLFQIELRKRSIGESISWVASGDSKEHLVNSFNLIGYGYLDPASFLNQPSSAPTYLSLVFSQMDFSGIGIAERLNYLLQIYSMTWVVLIGILSVSFAAATEVVWRILNPDKNETPKLLLICSSLIPLMSFSVGPALFDGFFTAIFGITITISLLTWFIESYWEKDFTPSSTAVGIVLFISSIFAWTFVVPFTGMILFLGLRNLFRKSKFNSFYVELVGLSALLGTIALVHLTRYGQDLIYKSKVALSTSGAVNATDTQFYFSAVSLLGLLGFITFRKNIFLGKSLLIIVLVELSSLFALKKYSNLSIFSWNYYLIKYQWIMLISLLAVAFAVGISLLYANLSRQKLHRFMGVAFTILMIYSLSETLVSTNRIWQKVWSGWQNPRGVTIDKLLEQKLDKYNPTMFFHFGYGGDDQLGNFWLNAFIDPVDPIKGWNYTIDTSGDPSQLCGVNYFYPSMTVITSDMKLEEAVNEICPDEDFTFKLEPSPI